MTATTATVNRHVSSRLGALAMPGLRPLLRKDLGEWIHGRRALVVLVVAGLFMTLAAANSWLNAWVIANVPEAAEAGASKAISLVPLDNIGAAVASQIFIFAAILAAMSLIVRERDSGTLAWVASKPVSRSSILVSKWLSATAVLWVVAGLVPLGLTAVAVTVLYGAPPIGAVLAAGLGIGAAIGLFVGVTLAASTFTASQPAVAAIGFAAVLVPTIATGIIPFDIAPFLPTSILSWAMAVGTGVDAGFVTPIAWVAGLAAVGLIGARRMASLEL
jgi:ABC-type transport system involved in multi-copper enzyme maturation permease subunit